jgi:hypothetical protein
MERARQRPRVRLPCTDCWVAPDQVRAHKVVTGRIEEMMVNKHLLTTAALLLVIPDAALAQRDQHDRGGPGQAHGGTPQGRPSPSRPTPPQARPDTRPSPGGGSYGRPSRPETRPTPPYGGNPSPGHGNRPTPGPGNRPSPGHGRPPSPGQGRPPFRPGAGRPPNFRPIHGSPFRYPRGYHYRRWSVGLLLPSLFLSSAYYYNDYDALESF